MRVSPQRHVLAVLRLTIGLTQKEMADLVKRSVVTIQKIELGKLNLSPELAADIHHLTGVDAGWLAKNDVSAPIVTAKGKPYTKQNFENVQAVSKGAWGAAIGSETTVALIMPLWFAHLGQLAINAQYGEKAALFNFLVMEAMDSLQKRLDAHLGNGLRVRCVFDKWVKELCRDDSKTSALSRAQEVCATILEDVHQECEILYAKAMEKHKTKKPSTKK